MNHIPTVDLNDYRQGNPEQKAAFVKALGDSFSQIGFAIVKNHGVGQDTIDGAYSSFQEFFALSDDVKQGYEDPHVAGQRGYTSKGKEHAKGRNVGDLKEFYHIGQIVEDNDPIKSVYPDNIWVNEVPQLKDFGVSVYKALEDSGRHLLRAIAEYLGLPVDYFDPKIHHGNSILRPIHYFPITNPDEVPDGAVRAAEHEDINLITLLLGASAEGLQVMGSDGAWIDAKPNPDEIVINVGDMLQRLTNNLLKSTTHRVVNPPREKMNQPRYSMPFFLHPRAEMDLTCLDSCVDGERPLAYEPITAGEYLEERLREIGLRK
ncbi:MAG: isopenicillin N synthase family dioxygenase [Bacteroidia bacterium]